MRVLIVAVGSRGDVVPYTGLGVGLRADGHEVTIAANADFAAHVRAAGLGFAALPGDVRALIAAPGPQSPLFLARRVSALTEYLRNAALGTLAAADEGVDVLLFNSSALFCRDVAEGFGVPAIGVFSQPIEPTADFPPILANSARSLGGWGNRLSGRLVLDMLTPYHRAAALVRQRLGLSKRAQRWSGPVLHGYSPVVLPRPRDWLAGLDVVGYWWPHRPADWSPPASLVDFLATGPAPVFLGFGSMAGGQGGWLTELTVEALRLAGVRAVVQAGWAGLDGLGDDVLTIGDVPHEWLFPRMSAVVHHGGAGTTGAGLRAGVPTVTTPIYADQPLWGARVRALGVGPAPLPMRHLTPVALATAIRAAATNPDYRAAAGRLAERIAKEDAIKPVRQAVNQSGDEQAHQG